MIRSIFKILATLVALCFAMGTSNAQSKAFGANFSITGAGFSYEHYVDNNSFLSLNLCLDADDLMWLRATDPGASASLVWNMVFKEKTSVYGNKISFFAGPGIMTGYVTDLSNTAGAAFGLMGRVGLECRFQRPVMLSVSLSPILGCHITTEKEEVRMRLYKSGLLQFVIPEIGIKYAF